jgi:hypothetical protein
MGVKFRGWAPARPAVVVIRERSRSLGSCHWEKSRHLDSQSTYLDSVISVGYSHRSETDDASLHGRPIGSATAGRLRLCPGTWTRK